ncbi:hypothetical protein [Aeromonas veronii]|uniref:hypothetical protein n=1 Tax=Aeromonas veronii TaxID=654 RepID=UPI003BA272CF
MIRLAIDLHKTITEIEALPVSELTTWLAHYSLEYERLHPPVNTPETITPQESRLALRSILA